MIETVQPEFLAVGILVGMGAFLIKCSFSATNSYQVVKVIPENFGAIAEKFIWNLTQISRGGNWFF